MELNRAQKTFSVITAIQAAPRSYAELEKLTGLSRPAVRVLLTTGIEAGCLHIADYRENNIGQKTIPLFRWGPKPVKKGSA